MSSESGARSPDGPGQHGLDQQRPGRRGPGQEGRSQQAQGRHWPDQRGADPGGRRWLVLLVGLIALTAGCTFQYGLAYLIPALRHEGFSLELAGVLVACPTAGLLVTLIGWGAAADRWGERVVLSAGLSLAGLTLLAAREVSGVPALGACLALAGAAGGSVFAASGRLILGWFARRERGVAMGIRQGAQPLGVAIAALTLPALGAGGRGAPLLFLAVFCLVSAALVVLLVRDPDRPVPAAGQPPAASPYRQPVLWRIHAASALLVVPQFTVATFALVFLTDARGWEAAPAGRLLAVAQICGAAARLAAGYWSDRAGSRLRPMRILAVSTGIAMLALAGAAAVRSPVAVAVLLACSVVAVSTNGLAFTAVAEHAGSAWAGRALGVQNTGQNALAAATPPVLAAAIGAAGFGAPFAAVALFPLVAAMIVPVAWEGRAGPGGVRAGARTDTASPSGNPADSPAAGPATGPAAGPAAGPQGIRS